MRLFPLTLAVLTGCNWIASVMGFRWAMGLFADFKIEMAPLTLLMMWATQGIPLLLSAAFVGFTSFAMARRARVGWRFSFVSCLMCDLVFLAYALLVNTFIDTGGYAQGMSLFGKTGLVFSALSQMNLLAITEAYEVGALLLAASFVVTQVIFGALIFGSRSLVAPRSQSKEFA